MNSKGIVALTDTDICMKCLKKKATHTYRIYGRGYGSSFDMSDTKFQCCDAIVDGPFIEEKKTFDCPFRGSSNQRIIKKGTS